MDRQGPGYKGYKDYTPRMLSTYDDWVLGFMSRRVWRTGVVPALDLYRNHMDSRHLDVGPGTGYLIAAAEPSADLELTLVDANPHVLAHCSETLAEWNPSLVEANVLEPLPVERRFQSAGLAHVIHCLPGPMPEKAPAVAHIADKLDDDGVLFGGTVLGLGEDHSWAARNFLRLANLQGGFDNRTDDVTGLGEMLETCFEQVDIDVTGSIAYFVCLRPKRATQGSRSET